jgi:HPt (histidine-containing phosphotransfer) domain-containing protein
MESVLDADVVNQLRALARAGSPELLERLRAAYARDTPDRLRALRAAVATGDRDAAAFSVHALKGSAANLGARQVVMALERIESAAPGTGAAELEPLLAALERHAADAEAELALVARAG